MNYLGSPNIAQAAGDPTVNIPSFPYQAHLATAGNIEGPWAKQGKTLPLNLASYETNCNVFGSVIFDGSTYHAFYSAQDSSSPNLRGIGRATASNPAGPWTNQGLVLPGSEQVENAVVLFADGLWYMIVNHIGYTASAGEFTVSNVMYWSDSLTSWNAANKTACIWPTYGGWDGKTIGCPGIPVVENGVCYITYDGTNTTSHNGRDGQVAEAVWPPASKTALSLASGASVTTPVSVGDGTVRIRFRPTGTGTVRIGLGSATGTRIGFYISSDTLYTDNSGTTASTGYGRVNKQTKTYEVRRSGSTATLLMDGVLMGTLTTGTSALPVFVSGEGVLEDIEIQQASVSSAIVGSEAPLGLEVGSPFEWDGSAITASGCPIGQRTSGTCTLTSSGGVVRVSGRYDVSLDGSSWAKQVTIGSGTQTFHLGVTPQAGDGVITTRLEVAL
jgi:hypothetical protein